MGRFDAHEQGYARVDIPRDDIEAVSWQRLPAQGHIWVYVPVPQGHVPGEDLPNPGIGFPVSVSYGDVVLEGALDFGPAFARKLIETTTGWSHFQPRHLMQTLGLSTFGRSWPNAEWLLWLLSA